MKHFTVYEKKPTSKHAVVLHPVQNVDLYIPEKSVKLNNEEIVETFFEEETADYKLKGSIMMLSEENYVELESKKKFTNKDAGMNLDEDVNSHDGSENNLNEVPNSAPVDPFIAPDMKNIHQESGQNLKTTEKRQRKPAQHDDEDICDNENGEKMPQETQGFCQRSYPIENEAYHCKRLALREKLKNLSRHSLRRGLTADEQDKGMALLSKLQHSSYCPVEGPCKNGHSYCEKLRRWMADKLKCDTGDREMLILQFVLVEHAVNCNLDGCPMKLCHQLRSDLELYESNVAGHVLYSDTALFQEKSLVLEGFDWWHVCTEKAGQGATGHVYKGLLVAGQEIVDAVVKRADSRAIEKELEFATRLNGSANILAPQAIIKWIGNRPTGKHRAGDGAGVIIMEAGECSLFDLLQLWKREHQCVGFPLEIAVHFMKMIIAGTTELHGKGLLHRDIKSRNVIVFGGGLKGKLADFDGMVDMLKPRLCSDEELAGTAGFAAPEVFAHSPATPALDVYSLGKTCYELMVDEPYFPPPKNRRMRRLMLQTIWRDVHLDLKGIKNSLLRRTLRRCICRDPSKRPTLFELAQLFDRLPCATVQEIVDNVSSLLTKESTRTSQGNVFINRTKQCIRRNLADFPGRCAPMKAEMVLSGEPMDVDE